MLMTLTACLRAFVTSLRIGLEVSKIAPLGNRFHLALLKRPILAALMVRPICLQKRGEELLHEVILAGLGNDYVNQFQARQGWVT